MSETTAVVSEAFERLMSEFKAARLTVMVDQIGSVTEHFGAEVGKAFAEILAAETSAFNDALAGGV